ncbi:hypothetical protein EVAR_101580_1 [Eumeta japonica]|uniref:Uncharacterized protein n=1 Tax=Eumeta variegata TaxID=151549 RepID=A0A4C1T741_EUMVA|nr:hypothetical protein EVAR_101580_1 [Eumeta japonica]
MASTLSITGRPERGTPSTPLDVDNQYEGGADIPGKVEDMKAENLEFTNDESKLAAKNLQLQNQASASVTPAGYSVPKEDNQLTDQGYFDIKFYHSKLW